MTLNPIVLGSLIIFVFFGGGLLFCLSVCMTLWLRYKGDVTDLCSMSCYQRQKMGNLDRSQTVGPPGQPSTSIVLSTISYSETQSEPSFSSTTVTSASPLSSFGGKTNFRTFSEKGTLADFCQDKSSASSGNINGKSHRGHMSLPPRSVRPSSLSLNLASATHTIPRRTTIRLHSVGGVSPKLSPGDFRTFPSDTDESVSSPQIPSPSDALHTHRTKEKQRFSIGHINVRVQYFYMSNSLQIDLLRNYQLPRQMQYQESDLYAKFVLICGQHRIRRSKSMNTDPKNLVAASFDHQINMRDLSKSSMILSLCKNLDTPEHGMLIGSATIIFESLGITDMLNNDFDSGIFEVPLRDSAPQQLVNCGGFLKLDAEHRPERQEIALINLAIDDINLKTVQFKDETAVATSDAKGAIYLKITVYEKGRAICWRRTQPVIVTSMTKHILIADQVTLKISSGDIGTMQTVLSIRLKTGKRGERKILGDLNLTKWWTIDKSASFEQLGGSNPSRKTNLKIPLQ